MLSLSNTKYNNKLYTRNKKMNAKLYIVASPIGNLSDISLRALEILKKSDLILCEDTRHTRKLLNHHNIAPKKIISIHQHNEKVKSNDVLQLIKDEGVASYLSDAGTPCISDPGMYLVQNARNENIEVLAIPGACAAISAFSISGITNGRFTFYGFLPTKLKALEETFIEIKKEKYPVILYESPKKIIKLLKAIVNYLGEEKKLFISREMTKLYETSYSDSAKNLLFFFTQNENFLKGEFVVIIQNQELIFDEQENHMPDMINFMKLLLSENLPLKQIVKITSSLYLKNKKDIYNLGLKLKNE